MKTKEHDLFMEMLDSPQASFNDMVLAGLTPENSYIEDLSVYKSDEWVRGKLTNEEGNFDENKLNNAYLQAKLYYNNLADGTYNEAVQKTLSFHRDNIFAPKEQRRTSPDFQEVKMANPNRQIYNLTTLGKINSPTQSIDEIAQSNKVLINPTTAGSNLENAQWDDSPNDKFLGNFFETLVLAQYDEDGTHTDPITGETVEHKKGEFKLNNNGEYYYERLDGRDVYGKQVLNKMNVLTTDGSYWNKFDFFDSDDITQKSIGGSILKNAALVGTMFIPGIGPWVTGLSVAIQLAGLGATFGKMLIGSDNSTLSAIEGWSKSLNRQNAKSQYAQENTWCWENYINLVGDVMGQLQEQRFIFNNIPALFKGSNGVVTEAGQAAKLKEFENIRKQIAETKIADLKKSMTDVGKFIKARNEIMAAENAKAALDLQSFVKGYQKIGDIISKGYMTAITVGDTYEEAKQAGASDLDATLLTLGYAAGEYALLNTGIGEWVLPELREGRYKAQAIAKALTGVKQETANLRQEFGNIINTFPKEGKKQYAKKLFNIGRKIATAEYVNGTKALIPTLAASVGEGIEEVSEEILADFSKGCYDVVKWLQGDNTRINTFGYDFSSGKWNSKEVIDRYGMSLAGGFVGGGLTNLATSYKSMKEIGKIDSTKAMNEIIYMIRNGEINNFLKQLDKMELANPYLSATEYETIDGNTIQSPGTETNNLDLYAKQVVRQQVEIIRNILEANGANLSDDSFLRGQVNILEDLRFNALLQSTTAGDFINEYNQLSARLTSLVNNLDTTLKSAKDLNKDNITTDRENRSGQEDSNKVQKAQEIEEEIKKVKQQIDDLRSGKRSYEFISRALFEMTPELGGVFATTTFPLFAENKYKKKFSELTENEKELARIAYDQWMASEGRDVIRTVSEIYRQVSEQASKIIVAQGDKYIVNREAISSLQNVLNTLNQNPNISQDLAIFNPTIWSENAQAVINSTYPDIMVNLINTFGFEADREEISNIYNEEIDPNLSDEEKSKILDERKKAAFLAGISINIRNLQKIIQPVMDAGFINAETRFQLQDILTRFKNVVVNERFTADQNYNETGDPSEQLRYNYFDGKVSEINALQDLVNNLKQSPFEENFNEFTIAIGKEPINISQLINKLNLSLKDVSTNISRFNLDQNLSAELNNAIYTLQIYRAAILGARTDNAGLNNYFGYNATLNEVGKKSEGDYPELAEIDSKTADILIEDININLNKLQFLQTLYGINQGSKLAKQDRVATKKDLLIYSRLKSIVTVPDDDELRTWKGFLELQTAINNMSIHESLTDNNSIEVAQDKLKDFSKEKLSAENAIYKFFQDNIDKLNDVNELVKFLAPWRFQLYSRGDKLLNEETDSLDDNSIIWWIASRAAVKSQDFYNNYKQIINLESDHPLAPVPTQELSVYLNYAGIINGNVFSQFQKAIRKSIMDDWSNKSIDERKQVLRNLGFTDSDADYYSDQNLVKYAFNFLPVPRYSNIILTEGIPGSGKSQAVIRQVLTLLNKFHKNQFKNIVIAHGAGISNAEQLKTDIGVDEATVQGREELMKMVNPSWEDYEINPTTGEYVIPKDHTAFTDENEIVSSQTVTSSKDNSPNLIVIDEIQKFTSYDLDQINKYAKDRGITVIVAGDFDQIGVVGSHPVLINGEKNNWKVNLERTYFVRSPKLGIPMRTDNSLKTTNQQKIQAYMQDPIDQEISLEYYENETGLYGDKVLGYYVYSDTLTQEGINDGKQAEISLILEEIEKLKKTLKTGEKIGYIFTDTTSPIYEELSKPQYSDIIDLKQGSSALGLEGRYYIIEATPLLGINNPNQVIQSRIRNRYLQDIYTGVSRSSQGSILIMPTNAGPVFKSQQMSSIINEEVGKNVILQYAERYKNLLDKIVIDGSKIEYIPRSTEDNVTILIPPKINTGGLEDGVDSEPPRQSQEAIKEKETTIQAINQAFTLNSVLSIMADFETKFPDLANDVDLLEAAQSKIQEIKESIQKLKTEIQGCEDIAELDKLELDYKDNPILEEVKNDIAIRRSELDPDNPGNPIVDDDSKQPDTSNFENIQAAETTQYEDSLTPITGIDLKPEDRFKEQLDESSKSTNIPTTIALQSLQSESSIGIEMLLHSFNTHELGVRLDENGRVIIDDLARFEKRIDSINGLVKIDQLKGLLSQNPTQKELEDYINNKLALYDNRIGILRTILFNTKSKAELEKSIGEQLELPNVYITFALKSHNYDRNSQQEFAEIDINPFNKGRSESTRYNYSQGEDSDKWHPKSLVAIIGSNGNNVLELPLLALSSPFTILQAKDTNDNNPFIEVYNKFKNLKDNGVPYHEISIQLQEQFKDNPKYRDLMNLFRLYDFTYRSIFYVKDNNWTISKDLTANGVQFVTNRGIYQGVPGLNFDSTSEASWYSIEEFAKNPNFGVTSTTLLSINDVVDTANGNAIKVVKKGHSFVIVTSDRRAYNTDKKIIDRYIAECNDPTLEKKTQLIYILPPKASIDEYAENLKKILNRESGVQNIGELFTSYKLLKILMQDDSFKKELERKLKDAVSTIQQVINEIESLKNPDGSPNIREQKNILYRKHNWNHLGFPVKSLAGLFDGILVNYIYDINSINQKNRVYTLNQTNLDHVKALLSGENITGVYYNPKISKTNPQTIGPFYIPTQEKEYKLNGKPFKIHGKLDSWVFSGNMNWLVEGFLDSLKPNKNGAHSFGKDGYSYMEGHSKLGQPRLTFEQIQKNNQVKTIKQKTGLDLSTIYENNSIQEANKIAVDTINSSGNNYVAFVINGEVKVSKNFDILNNRVSIQDNSGNIITDISSLVDNNGRYNFDLYIGDTHYSAIFDNQNLEITPDPIESQQQYQSRSEILSIDEDTFQDYVTEMRSILGEMIEYDDDLKELLNSTSYEEFLIQLEQLTPFVRTEEYNSLLENGNLTDIQKQIIEELKQLEEFIEEDPTNVCMAPIIIKF